MFFILHSVILNSVILALCFGPLLLENVEFGILVTYGVRLNAATFMRLTNTGRGSIGSFRPRVLKHTGADDDLPGVHTHSTGDLETTITYFLRQMSDTSKYSR